MQHKIIFMGTPQFSVSSLEILVKSALPWLPEGISKHVKFD